MGLPAESLWSFSKLPETLTNDLFVNLLDMGTKSTSKAGVLDGRDRSTGELKWKGTVADLVFGSNSQLRALAEFYAASDAPAVFGVGIDANIVNASLLAVVSAVVRAMPDHALRQRSVAASGA